MSSKELKLNQVIAIANGVKSRAKKLITKHYQDLEKSAMLSGLSKTYEPIDEEGEKLPKEEKFIQLSVKDSIKEVSKMLKELIDIVGTQDVANCEAKTDIKVDEKVILKDVPVTHLLFLEKQLEDIFTFVNSFPTLDPAEKWAFSEEANCYQSEMKQTVRTKKVPKVIVKYEATEKHPAQTELIYEDIPVGYWNTIKFSGCIKKSDKDLLLDKIRKLQDAVKVGREEANGLEVKKVEYGKAIIDYIFE